MNLTNISVETAGLVGLMGYIVVFTGLFLLMAVIVFMGTIMNKRSEKNPSTSKKTSELISELSKPDTAPGTAGEIKLFDTEPKDAAIIMAIVAYKLGKPLNELRFRSIKEIK